MNNKLVVTSIDQEVKDRFLSYAMSVIVARALPSVNDGLKPVHRRILYAMYGLKLFSDKQFKKAARVVGEVIGKYHPHGDVAVYDALTKMIQKFATNNPLIDGHGNFGSVDGDAPAAMRYTEVKLSALANSVLEGLNQDTVDFVTNYDGSEKEPVVLPGLFPNLLVNGSIGIAVGMATSIPPHNLGEVVDTTIAYLKKPDLTVEEIVEQKLFQGPDFPTGAFLINNNENLIKTLKSGRGTYKIRAKYHLEEKQGQKKIVFDQIPYQINKVRLMENILNLIKEKKLDHIAELRDESNRLGIRLVVALKKEAQEEIVLNQLFKLTDLQTNFSLNLLALHGNQPQLMNLLTVVKYYVEHQIKVLVRKTKFLLREDQKKLEIAQALAKALACIEQVIKIIRQVKDQKEAMVQLQTFLNVNPNQAKAILEMRLQRLTTLENKRIQDDIKVLTANIEKYQGILNSPAKQKQNLTKRLLELKKRYATPRKTIVQAVDQFSNIEDEDLILHRSVLVCLTKNNYLKSVDLKNFHSQNRGGVGVKGITLNEGDQIKQVLMADTHDNLLFFTNLGKVYQLKTWKIPDLGRLAKGTPAQNLVKITSGTERIESIVRVSSYCNNAQALLFVTRKGITKSTLLSHFASISKSGKIAIKLRPEDQLSFVFPVQREKVSVIIGKTDNRIVRFPVKKVSLSGRATQGVIGTALSNPKKDYVVGASFALKGQKILSISSDGKGKLTDLDNYRITNRGAKGTIAVKDQVLGKKLVATIAVNGNEQLLIAKSSGKFIVIPLDKTRVTKSRSARGVKLVELNPGEKIMTVCVFKHSSTNSA